MGRHEGELVLKRSIAHFVSRFAFALMPVVLLGVLHFQKKLVGSSLSFFALALGLAIGLGFGWFSQYALSFDEEGVRRLLRRKLLWDELARVETNGAHVLLRASNATCHIDLTQFLNRAPLLELMRRRVDPVVLKGEEPVVERGRVESWLLRSGCGLGMMMSDPKPFVILQLYTHDLPRRRRGRAARRRHGSFCTEGCGAAALRWAALSTCRYLRGSTSPVPLTVRRSAPSSQYSMPLAALSKLHSQHIHVLSGTFVLLADVVVGTRPVRTGAANEVRVAVRHTAPRRAAAGGCRGTAGAALGGCACAACAS